MTYENILESTIIIYKFPNEIAWKYIVNNIVCQGRVDTTNKQATMASAP